MPLTVRDVGALLWIPLAIGCASAETPIRSGATSMETSTGTGRCAWEERVDLPARDPTDTSRAHAELGAMRAHRSHALVSADGYAHRFVLWARVATLTGESHHPVGLVRVRPGEPCAIEVDGDTQVSGERPVALPESDVPEALADVVRDLESQIAARLPFREPRLVYLGSHGIVELTDMVRLGRASGPPAAVRAVSTRLRTDESMRRLTSPPELRMDGEALLCALVDCARPPWWLSGRERSAGAPRRPTDYGDDDISLALRLGRAIVAGEPRPAEAEINQQDARPALDLEQHVLFEVIVNHDEGARRVGVPIALQDAVFATGGAETRRDVPGTDLDVVVRLRLSGGPAEPGGADDAEWSSRPARFIATYSLGRRGGPRETHQAPLEGTIDVWGDRVATDRLAVPDSELDSFYGRGPPRLSLGSTVILPSSER